MVPSLGEPAQRVVGLLIEAEQYGRLDQPGPQFRDERTTGYLKLLRVIHTPVKSTQII